MLFRSEVLAKSVKARYIFDTFQKRKWPTETLLPQEDSNLFDRNFLYFLLIMILEQWEAAYQTFFLLHAMPLIPNANVLAPARTKIGMGGFIPFSSHGNITARTLLILHKVPRGASGSVHRWLKWKPAVIP